MLVLLMDTGLDERLQIGLSQVRHIVYQICTDTMGYGGCTAMLNIH